MFELTEEKIFLETPELESKLGFITALVPDFMKHGIGYLSLIHI